MNNSVQNHLSIDFDDNTALQFEVLLDSDMCQSLSINCETLSSTPTKDSTDKKQRISKTRAQIKERLGKRKSSAVEKAPKALVIIHKKRSVLTPIEEEHSSRGLEMNSLYSDCELLDTLSEGFDMSIDSYNNVSVHSNDLKRISVDENSMYKCSPILGDSEELGAFYRETEDDEWISSPYSCPL